MLVPQNRGRIFTKELPIIGNSLLHSRKQYCKVGARGWIPYAGVTEWKYSKQIPDNGNMMLNNWKWKASCCMNTEKC